MGLRTDLIYESRKGFNGEINGCIESEIKKGEIIIHKAEIKNENASTILNKPQGIYYTVQSKRFDMLLSSDELTDTIAEIISELIPEPYTSVLVAGLGNTDITPDAVGPATADKIFATRHLDSPLRQKIGLENLRDVSVLIPGVIGKTGIEAAETVKAAADKINCDAVIVIDALAARHPERLCSTIQICDTGISPGSGVKNKRKALNYETLGRRVIAIGVPTVIDASTYRLDCGKDEKDIDMMVTPKDIDFLINRIANIVSDGINTFLQPTLDRETISELV